VAETVELLTAPEDAKRLDRWLADCLGISRSKVQALFKAGRVSHAGVASRPSQRVKAGQDFEVRIPEPPSTRLVQQDIAVPILHQDTELIVVDKPSGLVVHPGRGHPDGTLCNALLDQLDGLPGHPERPGIVHRLDMGTSGVMVVARTQAALEHLSAQFSAHTVDRRYLALVWGYVQDQSGTIDAPLARHPRDRVRFTVMPGGKHAVTHWRLLERARFKVPSGMGNLSLLECRLETGRTHQVRVHLSHLGHPIVGDTTYDRPVYKPRNYLPAGLREAVGAIDHPLLHARLLGFEHPDGSRMQRESMLPDDYQAVLDAAGIAVPQ
jgi:23S rRNA pseudouridine1911/1915/1917 synthase